MKGRAKGGGWVTWFSRGTEEGSVFANRVLKGTIKKLTA